MTDSYRKSPAAKRTTSPAPLRPCAPAPLLALFVLLAASVAAGDDIDTTLAEINGTRLIAHDPNAGAAERLAAIERVVDLRSVLISDHPDDPRHAVWLADQASDQFFQVLPIDDSGLTALFGLPAPGQLARAERVARHMHDLAAAAHAEIGPAIDALRRAPDFDRNPDVQTRFRVLVEQERDRRIPFLRGIGAYLYANLIERDAQRRRDLYRQAADILGPLGGRLPGRLAGTAELYAGLALVGVDLPEPAGARFEAVAGTPGNDPDDVLAARLGLVAAAAARGGPAAGRAALDGLDASGRAALLVADQRFKLTRQLASSADGRERATLLRRSFDAYLRMLEDRSVDRTAVLARLIEAADDDAPLGDLPAIVTAARARRLARESRPDEAKDLLAGVLSRTELDPADRAETLVCLGRVHLEQNEMQAAAERFLEVARDHPTDPHAERAIELAAAITAEQHRRAPDDPLARDALRRALDVLLDRYPNLPAVNRWRYVSACLALDEQRSRDAVELFDGMAVDAPQWVESRVRRVRAIAALAAAQADPPVRRERYADLAEAAADAVAVVRNASAAPQATAWLATLATLQARAQLELGEPGRALETLDGAEAMSVPLGSEAVEVRIEAHWARDDGGATRRIRQLAEDAGPGSAAILLHLLRDRREAIRDLAARGRDDEAAAVAGQQLAPLAEALENLLAADPGIAGADALWLAAADAFRDAGRFREAADVYGRLLVDHPDAIEPLLGRAECLYGLGAAHDAEAMRIFRRIAEVADPGGDRYWRSHLRMLQILSRSDRNTQRIVPHIDRLRQRDRDLGGEQFKREFERLERKHR